MELALWTAVFAGTQAVTVAGFTKSYYLSYVLWTAFVTRITTNWMYEHRMIEEISSGTVNSLIVRPMSFFEYYLSQLLGYKILVMACSFFIPAIICEFYELPVLYSRLPVVLFLVIYYLIFVQLMSFFISTLAFHLNRVWSLTVAKNLGLWIFTGELFPLDILPEPFKSTLIHLPFANAVYIPVGYLTGRFESDILWVGFASCTVGILLLGAICVGMWKWGLKTYSGTGA